MTTGGNSNENGQQILEIAFTGSPKNISDIEQGNQSISPASKFTSLKIITQNAKNVEPKKLEFSTKIFNQEDFLVQTAKQNFSEEPSPKASRGFVATQMLSQLSNEEDADSRVKIESKDSAETKKNPKRIQNSPKQ